MMKTLPAFVLLALLSLLGCNKPATPASSSRPASPSDTIQQKLEQYAGASATDCGRLGVRTSTERSKAASDCALQASQGKRPFYVAYDMPGMVVGVAGNAEGKLFTVQSQEGALTSGDCPAQLRVAASGRVTCFAPGDMGSMSSSHASGAVPSGATNPHSSSAKPPSN